MVEARRSLARETVGRLRATCSKAPLTHAYVPGTPEMPTPAAAFKGDDANSAVDIFREKNATNGVSHKVVANATILERSIDRMPLLRVQYLTGGKQVQLQRQEVELLQSVRGFVAMRSLLDRSPWRGRRG